MQTFVFRARNSNGLAVNGKLDASNAYEARKLLAQQQLIPVELKPYVVWLDLGGILSFLKKLLFQVPFEDILIFYTVHRDALRIVRVLHGKQDIKQILEREKDEETPN